MVVDRRVPVRSLEPQRVVDLDEWWVIDFELAVPEGELWIPGTVSVEIDKATGAATLVPIK